MHEAPIQGLPKIAWGTLRGGEFHVGGMDRGSEKCDLDPQGMKIHRQAMFSYTPTRPLRIILRVCIHLNQFNDSGTQGGLGN